MQLMHLLSEQKTRIFEKPISNRKSKIDWQNRQLDLKRSFETTGNSAEVNYQN